MKKIIVILLVLLMMAGCAGDKTPSLENMSAEEQYQTSTEVMKNVTSMEAEMTMNLTMTFGEESMTQPMKMKMKITDAKEIDKMAAEILMTMQDLEESMEIAMYIKEGYMYMEMLGTKIKMAMTEELASDYTGQVEVAEFDPNTMTNMTSKKTEDGYLISYDMSADILNEAIASSLTTMQEQMPGAEMVFNGANGTMLIDENAMTKQVTMIIDMSLGYESEEINMVMDMKIDYMNLNNVTITFPEDLDSYTEY